MNIKKYILFCGSLFLLIFSNVCLSATKYIQDVHYELIKKSPKIIHYPKTPITEFFSFLCPHCYDFYNMTQTKNLLVKNFLKNLQIKKYHIDSMGDTKLAKLATYNWSIAIALNVENKVIIAIFEGIQKSHKIYNYSTMKKIFIKAANIDKNIYDAAWNSFIVKALNAKQIELANAWNVTSIPFIVVNNKYHIILDSLNFTSTNIFLNDYINLIKVLLKKEN
ncbi:thiol:disulfide interchange protein DsbA [Enterobacteriaceae endosymbiont of Plateumaris consimilis]|uniref:DsbA family protein n=1 Tax=Enterobacteriaceae endosymbiont of Plateumaris consimilis TaxID=2675794 RepID=UPI0014497B19|nr:DsbA family protein [Enterobacteriaceae endosymbiont of Plateumaris consimilis]QJC28783.1 thiol:disulfide interchange protein DsbA [Enterobacteriaceae endosymbiont of Plateumaris consimilis]